MKEGFIKSFDGYKVYRYLWDDVNKPKGIVQIFHGMAEHAKRYDDFAKFLNSKGYIVFADDHRAHGKTAGKEKVGTYDGHDVAWETLMDEIYFSRLLTEEYKLPLYVFGHSYGSFILQGYLQKTDLYEKAILCGSACMKDRLDVKFGKIVARNIIRKQGLNVPATPIAKLSFGRYDKKFKEGSWLNTNADEVAKYYADPYCGKVMSAGFYEDFFSLFDWIYNPNMLEKVNKKKPIYIISGKQDMVGNKGKLVKKLFKMYISHDVEGVEMRLYDNARHEILNEPNTKEEVYNDILKFIEK